MLLHRITNNIAGSTDMTGPPGSRLLLLLLLLPVLLLLLLLLIVDHVKYQASTNKELEVRQQPQSHNILERNDHERIHT